MVKSDKTQAGGKSTPDNGAEQKPLAPGRINLLRWDEVERRTGFSKSHIFALRRRGEFPAPIKLGTRSFAWDERDIDGWIAQRIATAKGGAA